MQRTKAMVNITQVSKASKKTPTLRTSIPLELARDFGISDGDSVIWTPSTQGGKKGFFVRKVE